MKKTAKQKTAAMTAKRKPAAKAPARKAAARPSSREVETELAQILVDPRWQDIGWISGLDLMLVRDSDVTSELLDEHLRFGTTRELYDRLTFFRTTLTPAHRPLLVEALENAPKLGLVELLSYTCESAKDFASALRKAGAGKELKPAIDYALRRFIAEPGVAGKLAKTARSFATTAAGGTWNTEGEQAFRALYVCDTRETADITSEMIAATYIYTNYDQKERVSSAAAKRARMLAHGKRCAKPLVEAMQESYTREEFTHSAVAIQGAKVKPALEAKWREYTTFQVDNNPARVALGGLLALSPKAREYHEAARTTLPKLLRETTGVGWKDVGLVNGIVMGIERGKVKPLYPLLEKVARWKITGSVYDGRERAELSAALVRRRARQALDRA